MDKLRLIELCGASESEFSSVRNVLHYWGSMYSSGQLWFSSGLLILMQSVYMNFVQVSTCMKDLCFDTYGISKERKYSRDLKGNRGTCNFVLLLRFHFTFHFLVKRQLTLLAEC